MDLGRGSVFSILRSLEQGSLSNPSLSFHGHTAFVRQMQCTAVLEGHRGCVNRLALSQDATLLLSGSDDCTLRVWRVHAPTKISFLEAVSPGHHANIFGVAFMPNTSSSYVASAGLDRQVRHTHIPTARSTLWTCHDKMVKTVSPIDTHTFVSASKDGTARRFDTRVSPSSSKAHHSDVVVRIPSRHRRYISLNSALVSPLCSHHLLVTSKDSRVRILDLRLSISNRRSKMNSFSSTSAGQAIEDFCPPHLQDTAPEQCGLPGRARCAYATYAGFSSDAKQVVASYYDDTVHVFDRAHHTHDLTYRSPFPSRSAKEAAIWAIIQDTARVLQLNYPSVAIGRANRVLEMDPNNLIALLYRADGLLRREGLGDFRASYATLDKLIQIIRKDCSRIVELWGYEEPSGVLCFSSEVQGAAEKAEMWLKVFEYMQALALFCMISESRFGTLPRPNSSDRLLTKKRLEHLSRVCADLERFRAKSLQGAEMNTDEYRTHVRGRALGSSSENKTLYRTAASKIRGKVLSCLLDRFISGIDELRDEIDDRKSRFILHHSDSEFSYTGDGAKTPCDKEDSELENRIDKRENEELFDMKKEECHENIEEEAVWGRNLRNQRGFRSFYGHTSRQTEIKEANFYGSRDQVVVSGSDDGFVYLWSSRTSELLTRVYADSQIVNCVLAHPKHSMIIASGIDDTIKMITPQGHSDVAWPH